MKVAVFVDHVQSGVARWGHTIRSRAIKSWQSSLARHRRHLKRDWAKRRLLIATCLYVLFLWALFDADWKLAFSFMFAGAMALYSGIIYKGQDVMGLVLIGVMLGATVPTLVPGIRESFSEGDYISTAVLIGVGIVIYCWSTTLKKEGEVPEDWTTKDTPKAKQRRRRTK